MNGDWCCFVTKSNWRNSNKRIGAVSILVGWVVLFVQFHFHCLDNMHLECRVLFAVCCGALGSILCAPRFVIYSILQYLQYFTVFYSILQYLRYLQNLLNIILCTEQMCHIVSSKKFLRTNSSPQKTLTNDKYDAPKEVCYERILSYCPLKK